MSTPLNILSLDVGGRRIGVALGNSIAQIASPLMTLDRKDDGDIFDRIEKLIRAHEVKVVIVGCPRGMQGQDTEQTAIARSFTEELTRIQGITVYMQDEAATSIVAEEKLKQIGKPYTKGDIDMGAAVIILDDWFAQIGAPE